VIRLLGAQSGFPDLVLDHSRAGYALWTRLIAAGTRPVNASWDTTASLCIE